MYNPERFQGSGKTSDYFEGWYFKLVDKNRQSIAVVPGIFYSTASTPEHNHAFIFVTTGTEQHYYRFPVDEFVSKDGDFQLKIGGCNLFSASGITLDLKQSNEGNNKAGVRGQVEFSGSIEWPVTLLNPGVMGWVAYLPRKECVHSVVSMDHTIRGSLEVTTESNETTIMDFDGSAVCRGYTEKDWGKHFPQAWVWIQTNHFDKSDDTGATSLFYSSATVPYLGTTLPGFICGFHHQGTLHKFTTYYGSTHKKFAIDRNAKTLEIVLANWTHTLTIKTDWSNVPMVTLHGPWQGQMQLTVPEGLKAQVHVCLKRSRTGEVVFEGMGTEGGIEIQRDVESLSSSLV